MKTSRLSSVFEWCFDFGVAMVFVACTRLEAEPVGSAEDEQETELSEPFVPDGIESIQEEPEGTEIGRTEPPETNSSQTEQIEPTETERDQVESDDKDTDSSSDMDEETDIHTDSNTDMVPRTDAEADTDNNLDTNTDADTDSDSDEDSDVDTHTGVDDDQETDVDATLFVDGTIRHQTIDGFGFFGGRDAWWMSSDPDHFYSEEWLNLVVGDLGITIWRNEHYPPSDSCDTQDADWDKQRPMVEALKRKADDLGVDVKFLYTVWSPPASMKCYVDDDIVRQTDTPHSDCTKGGGALDHTQYDAFAAWLIQGIDNYQASGIDLYALSPQNEPYFWQSFNSCFYAQAWYAEMLNGVIPAVKAAYPNVKIFGAENMLSMEAGSDWPYFYHGVLMDDPTAADHLDILAVHGYSDGVAPDSGSTLAGLWRTHLQEFAEPMNKPNWMTETSGYVDEWENGTNGDGDARPGALALAMDIHAALFYGNLQGWVWWQGSELGSRIGEFVLMNGTEVGEKYAASKHFYRFIRPGAVRLETASQDDDVFLTAYEHSGNGTLTIVAINAAYEEKTVTIGVSDTSVPSEQFEVFVSSETSECESQGTIAATSVFSMPARSVVTLQAGGAAL